MTKLIQAAQSFCNSKNEYMTTCKHIYISLYLNKQSFHHQSQKKAVLSTLTYRMNLITDTLSLPSELHYLEKTRDGDQTKPTGPNPEIRSEHIVVLGASLGSGSVVLVEGSGPVKSWFFCQACCARQGDGPASPPLHHRHLHALVWAQSNREGI